MQIIKLSQRDDREAWLEERRGKATGSKAKKLYPLTRGADRTPAGIWDLVGELLSKEPDPEKPMDRGNRLEKEAVQKASKVIGLPFDDDTGMWVADYDSSIAISPDAAEPGDKPTYAMEAKALGAGKHFKYLFKSMEYTGNPIDLVPEEQGSYYKHQSIQYFSVNDLLETLYFVLYNPDAAYEEHELVIIIIKRKDVENLVQIQSEVQIDVMGQVREIVNILRQGIK